MCETRLAPHPLRSIPFEAAIEADGFRPLLLPRRRGYRTTEPQSPRCPVTNTMHAPASSPTREAGNLPDTADQPQLTVRVPVVYPPPTAAAFVSTPPPTSGRKLSRSVFTDTTADESGVGLKVGDTFLGFELVEELGQGAFARVFLAHQQSLAGRPVALKVTLRPTREAERLRATSAHQCCPSLLGPQCAAGTGHLHAVSRSADHCRRDPDLSRRTPVRRIPRPQDLGNSGRADYRCCRERVAVKGQDWQVRHDSDSQTASRRAGRPFAHWRSARGTASHRSVGSGSVHAHGRGILHLDLKPANVLLPDIGEPMLLDFNLSFDTTIADRELVGGTVPYMATEQLLDLRTRGRGAVDARTDLYSLGVMAFEMLTGAVPFPAASRDLIDMDGLLAARRQGPPSIRELNPNVTPATEAIIWKLLAPEPNDRYQTAEELKTDIDRHLNNLPLAFAREPSPRERIGKWRRRNPGVAGRLLAASLVGLLLGVGAIAYQQSEARATAQAVARVQHTRAALDATRLDLILPADSKTRARGVAKAEQLLAAYDLPQNSEWMKRSEVRRLSEPERIALAGDLGELLLLLGQAKWQEVSSKTNPVREEGAMAALALNRAAQMCFPANAQPPLLDRQAAELAVALGQKAEVAAAVGHEPTTARDRFLDAASVLTHGKFMAAIPILELVVADQPNHAAAHFCLAYSRQQIGQVERALERYDVAEKLLPGDPRPAFQRGVLCGMQSNFEEAEKEFTQAIALAPDHAQAYRNRGFARFRQDKFKEAEADLTRALDFGAPAIQVHLYRKQVRTSLGDKAGAIDDQRLIATMTPREEADYIARGRARLGEKDWQGALDDFRAAAEINPRSLAAFQNKVYVLGDRLNQPQAALEAATRMNEIYPDYAAGRIARAVYLARLGHRDEAHAETKKALALSKKDPNIYYRAACVFALTSANNPDDSTKALTFLECAVKNGYRDFPSIKSDKDLSSIRGNSRFRQITDAAASLFR